MEGVMKISEDVWCKRMGDHAIGGVLGMAEVGGKGLPVYSIGDTTYQSSNITRMNWPDGRYFGEAGGSGKSMIHQFGENIGKCSFGCGTSRYALAEESNTRGLINKASEGSD